MCAIAGMINLPIEDSVIKMMEKTMKRRGPDDFGCTRGKGHTLLHSRLAIIDPDGGAQPMKLNWAGECYTIVYNGELYNTSEIRAELVKLGHQFEGHSDTEILLHGYAQWGERVLDLLNGIYAFGVWEEKSGSFFLARDRMGVKPLFYSLVDDGLIFASEIKTILVHPRIKPVLDEYGAAQVLLLGPGRLPGSGVFKGIKELEPGYCARFENGHFQRKRYWHLSDREHTQTFEQTVEQVRFLVKDAICRQMVSDVPIGCFLSGGLDSSIISSVCAGEMKKKGEKLRTFSVDYLDNDLFFKPGAFQPNADGKYIRMMCDHIGSEHHWTTLTPKQLWDHLKDATIARDLPGMADVDFSLLAFCGQIRPHVKVALSGECADEIFGGYPWYRDPAVRNADGFPWAQNSRDRIGILSPEVSGVLDASAFIQDAYRTTVNEADILPGTDPLERRMKEMVNLNLKWFMQTLLDRKDRMSMYHGLEVRVPFCDHRIAEYMYGVPWEMKDHQGREKGLLREAVKDLLPHQIFTRKKSPYPKTHHPEYSKIVRDKLQTIMQDKNAKLFMIVSRDALKAYLERTSTWPWYGQLMTGPQTMAYFLQIQFWLEHYQIEFAL